MAASDFEGLDILAGNRQVQQQAIKRGNSAALNLADAIDQSRDEIIGIQSKFHAKKLQTMQQASQLAAESDSVIQDIARAQADPWHDLKVLFTDEKSIAELAAEQNLVQNRMNVLQRDNQQAVYEYQFNLSQVQQQLSSLDEKRKSALFDVNATSAQASAVVNQINAEAVIRDKQLQAFSYDELIQLRGDVTSGKRTDFADWEVESQIRQWQDLKNKADKTDAKDAVELFNISKAYIPEGALRESIRTGDEFKFKIPNTDKELIITQPMAQEAMAFQSKRNKERSTFFAESISNSTSAQVQQKQFENALSRYTSSFGIQLFKKTKDGVELDLAVMPGATASQVAQLTGIEAAIKEQEARLYDRDTNVQIGGDVTGLPETKQSQQVKFQTQDNINALKKIRAVLYTTMLNGIVEEAEKSYESGAGKTTIGQYIRTGSVNPNTEDTRVALSEVVVNNAAIGAGFTNYSSGWAEGFETLQAATLKGYEDAASAGSDALFSAFNSSDATEEAKTNAVLSLIAGSDKKKPDQIQREALHLKTKVGRNVHIQAVFNAWNKDALAYAIERLKAKHANEPQTLDALNSVLTARKGGRIADRYTIPDDGLFNLLNDLSNRSFVMQQQSALPEDVNLARELYQELVSPEFYNSEGIRYLTSAKNYDEELLAAALFNNNQHRAFMSTLITEIKAVQIQDITSTPAYDRESDIRQMVDSRIRNLYPDSVPTTEQYNDVLADEIARRRKLNPLNRNKQFEQRTDVSKILTRRGFRLPQGEVK